ncbi:MAG TPA: YceH family protein [Thermoleophilaceae bacterium]|nr:YceH family protein [Thermoleophilaceae bacterium]
MDLSPVEIRVLGALLEKQRTTPDAYPLTLNSLRLACNQSTNRDPVVEYDEESIREALDRLHRRGFTRLTSTHGSRAPKFRHLLDDALPAGRDELALLCVLMLRGPQTPGELKQRSERLHDFADLAAVHATLERLIERGLAAGLGRRPGQKEDRYAQLLGEGEDEVAASGSAPPAPTGESTAGPGDVAERLERLEARVAALERAVGG